MNIRVENYSPQLRLQVLDFLEKIYPYRSKYYFEYWIDNIEESLDKLKSKSVILFDENLIVGVALPNLFCIKNKKGETFELFSSCNVIISWEYRGKGLAKYLYETCNGPDKWITLGITNAGVSAYKRYVKHYLPLKDLFVYVTFNYTLLFPFKHIQDLCKIVNKGQLMATQITSIEDLSIPFGESWTEDDFEVVRDYDYLKKRFFDNYRSKEYHVYSVKKGTKPVGYFVVRRTFFKIPALALVDYRYDKKCISLNDLLSMVDKVAVSCRLGATITITSENLHASIFPFTFKTRKRLTCATNMDALVDSNNFLITSAETDLDFVYYR